MFRMLVSRLSMRMGWSAILFAAPILLCQNPAGSKTAPTPSVESSYAPHLSFDVASIREDRNSNGSSIYNVPKSSVYIAQGVSVRGLVLAAYGIKLVNLLQNLPEWAMNTRYNVTAKSDSATDEVLAKLGESDFLAEKRHMLQLLLAERFKLQIHPETRVATTYELVATEGAAKLMIPVKQSELATTVRTCAPAQVSRKGVEYESKGCPFSILKSQLEQAAGTNILDHTGMTGLYAYHLMYSDREPDKVQGDEEPYPNLVDAVREQLGLELKRTKGPVTSWIVDHIERATPN